MNVICTQIQEEKDFNKFEELSRELSELVARKQQRFPERNFILASPVGKAWKLMSAVATQVIPPRYRQEVEKVEISISEAEHLFREIRVENTFVDASGSELAIKQGAEVDVRLETNTNSLVKKTARPS